MDPPGDAAANRFGQDAERLALDEDEIVLLELVASGYPTSKMARLLAVSESTLGRKLRRVQSKLGANSRVNAVYLAAKRGLI